MTLKWGDPLCEWDLLAATVVPDANGGRPGTRVSESTGKIVVVITSRVIVCQASVEQGWQDNRWHTGIRGNRGNTE